MTSTDMVASVAQDLIELPVAQVGIPFRDAQLLLNHKLWQSASSCESISNLLICKCEEPSHHDRRVRIQLEDRAVHEAVVNGPEPERFTAKAIMAVSGTV